MDFLRTPFRKENKPNKTDFLFVKGPKSKKSEKDLNLPTNFHC